MCTNVAVIGNVDAGKSSLIGTLLSGKPDDGRGCNRRCIMNYIHELESGRTSSIGYQILGFRDNGSVFNIDQKLKQDSWPKIVSASSKLVKFIDLAGHEKYLKTTIHGMSSNRPDYAMILIEGKPGRGITGMTKEHIMLCLLFNVPFFIVITKIDLYPDLSQVTESVMKLLKNVKKTGLPVENSSDAEIASLTRAEFVPIFFVSNVTMSGISSLSHFLWKTPKRLDYTGVADSPFEISFIEKFSVTGVGTVIHGFVVCGTPRIGDVVWVGPDSLGNYIKSKIKTLHFNRVSCDFVVPGNHCTICLPGVTRDYLKCGMYILQGTVPRISVRKFTAEVKVVSTHGVTIKPGYCPVLNIDNTRLSAHVTKIDRDECIRGGDKAVVEFEFIRPVYLKPDSVFVFREGRTRGAGKVTSCKA